jgi:hypothetical protein
MDDYYFVFFTVAQCILLGALVVRPSPYRWMLSPLTAGLNFYCYFLTATSSATDDKFTNEALRCFVILNIVVA